MLTLPPTSAFSVPFNPAPLKLIYPHCSLSAFISCISGSLHLFPRPHFLWLPSYFLDSKGIQPNFNTELKPLKLRSAYVRVHTVGSLSFWAWGNLTQHTASNTIHVPVSFHYFRARVESKLCIDTITLHQLRGI